MIRTVQAEIDDDGNIRLLEPLPLLGRRKALVAILDDDSDTTEREIAALSERALAEDWDRPEEDAAWSHLQQAP